MRARPPNQVFRRAGASSAAEEVRFVERRVAELRSRADEAAARMREFQEKHHIVDLDTQSRAVVSSLTTLNTQSIGKRLEVAYARRFSSRDEASVRGLEAQLWVVDDTLRVLQEPRPVPTDQPLEKPRRRAQVAGGMFPAALAVPGLRAESEKLARERKVAEATLILALERLEAARADQARDVSLPDPGPPVPAYAPRQAPGPASVLVAAVAGLVAAVLLERLRNGYRARPIGGSLPLAMRTPRAE